MKLSKYISIFFLVSGCTTLPEMYDAKRTEIKKLCQRIESDTTKAGNTEKMSKYGREMCYIEGLKFEQRERHYLGQAILMIFFPVSVTFGILKL